jgi:cyanate permease
LEETLSVKVRTSDYRVVTEAAVDFETLRRYVFVYIDIVINSEEVFYSVKNKITGYALTTYFSIVVFMGVNLVCFIMMVVLYVNIFMATALSASKAGRGQSYEEEIRMARKMFVIVFTDFCCWVPLILVCICVQSGFVTVDPVVYAWVVAFILPINSALNPFLYTLTNLISERIT